MILKTFLIAMNLHSRDFTPCFPISIIACDQSKHPHNRNTSNEYITDLIYIYIFFFKFRNISTKTIYTYISKIILISITMTILFNNNM